MSPRPNTIANGFAFVGCPTRLGSIIRIGPVTGERHSISITGVWIDEKDAEILIERTEDVWCFKKRGNINIHTVLYLDPPRAELERIRGKTI